MGRILAVVLGLAVVAGAAYYGVRGNLSTNANGKSAPKQTLDNVREKTKQFEEDSQKKVDDMLKQTPQ